MNVSKVCGLASMLALASLAPLNSQGAVAYDFTPGGANLPGNQTDGDYALGATFTLNQPIFLTGLRVFDTLGDGLGGPVEVSIHSLALSGNTIQLGTRLATFTFSGSLQSYDGNTGTRFQAITPFQLNATGAGTAYMVVANRMGTGPDGSEVNYSVTQPGGGTTIPTDSGGGIVNYGANYYNEDATWTAAGSWFGAGSGWNFGGDAIIPNYAAGNFDFTPVPEAQHFALAGAALMGLVYVGRLTLRRKATA